MSAVSAGVVVLLSFMVWGVTGGGRWCWDVVDRLSDVVVRGVRCCRECWVTVGGDGMWWKVTSIGIGTPGLLVAPLAYPTQ